MLSMISTPGITGWLGKCPAKNGSLTETFFTPIADLFETTSTTRSSIRNG